MFDLIKLQYCSIPNRHTSARVLTTRSLAVVWCVYGTGKSFVLTQLREPGFESGAAMSSSGLVRSLYIAPVYPAS